MSGPDRFLPDAGIELGGRVSKKTTSISLPSGGQSFSSEYTSDPLGDIATLEYPTGDWPHESVPQRNVSYNRRLGFLNSVPGYASSTRTPEGARALSTATGEGAVELARAASSSGHLFEANIPQKALDLMLKAGLAVPKITQMTNPTGQLVTATEIRFQANVTEYLVGYFKAVP